MTKQRRAFMSPLKSQRTILGGTDVIGEADPAADVDVNGITATRQNEYFYAEVPVNNSTQPSIQRKILGLRRGNT